MKLLRELIEEILHENTWFHVTRTNHGKIFTFVPRVPLAAKELREEDCTTARVCLAPTVKSAIEAIGFDSNKSIPEKFSFDSKEILEFKKLAKLRGFRQKSFHDYELDGVTFQTGNTLYGDPVIEVLDNQGGFIGRILQSNDGLSIQKGFDKNLRIVNSLNAAIDSFIPARGTLIHPKLYVYKVTTKEIFVPRSHLDPWEIQNLRWDERPKELVNYVPDAKKTGEVWSLKPVAGKLIKIISATDTI